MALAQFHFAWLELTLLRRSRLGDFDLIKIYVQPAVVLPCALTSRAGRPSYGVSHKASAGRAVI